MINIRHHIASIIGIFLALGIGLVIGSTLISGETVDALEARLDAQEDDLDDTQGLSDELELELEELEALQARFESAAPEHLFEGRLDGESVMILTSAGTAEATLAQAVDVIRDSNAVSVGVLTIDEPIPEATIGELEAAVGQLAPVATSTTASVTTTAAPSTTAATSSTADPTPDDLPTLEEIEAFLAAAEAAASSTIVTTTTAAPVTTTVAPDASVVVLQGLLAAELASFDADESEVPRSSLVLAVFDSSSDEAITESIIELVRALDEGERPRAVVASGSAAQPIVAEIRADIDLALVVPTISHFDTAIGQFAAVLALEDLSIPFIEHYGSEEDLLLLPPGDL